MEMNGNECCFIVFEDLFHGGAIFLFTYLKCSSTHLLNQRPMPLSKSLRASKRNLTLNVLSHI